MHTFQKLSSVLVQTAGSTFGVGYGWALWEDKISKRQDQVVFAMLFFLQQSLVAVGGEPCWFTRSLCPAVPVIVRMPVLGVRGHHRSDYARVCCDAFRSDLAEVIPATQPWCSTAVCTVATLARKGLSWHKFVVRIRCLTSAR